MKEIIFSKLDQKGKIKQIQLYFSFLLLIFVFFTTLFSDISHMLPQYKFDFLGIIVFKCSITFPFLLFLVQSLYSRDKYLKKVNY